MAGFAFDTSLEIKFLRIAPKYIGDDSETWIFSLPRFEYLLDLRFEKKSTVASPPKNEQSWRIGFVQTVQTHLILIRFEKKEFNKAWSDPRIDSSKDSMPFFFVPTEKFAPVSDSELSDQDMPGQLHGPNGQASYDITYGPKGYRADFQANPFLKTVKRPFNPQAIDADDDAPELNVPLPLWISDYPTIQVPWRMDGVGQLMEIQEVVVFNFWIIATTPNKPVALAFSSPFTAASWMRFRELSDSKARDFRETMSPPLKYSALLNGNAAQKLSRNIDSLQELYEANPLIKVRLKLAGKKAALPKLDETETANDRFRSWIDSWTPSKE